MVCALRQSTHFAHDDLTFVVSHFLPHLNREAAAAFPFRLTHVLTDNGSCFTAAFAKARLIAEAAKEVSQSDTVPVARCHSPLRPGVARWIVVATRWRCARFSQTAPSDRLCGTGGAEGLSVMPSSPTETRASGYAASDAARASRKRGRKCEGSL